MVHIGSTVEENEQADGWTKGHDGKYFFLFAHMQIWKKHNKITFTFAN